MATAYFVERHIRLVNGATACTTLQAFATKELADAFVLEQKAMLNTLLSRPTLDTDSKGMLRPADPVGAILASLMVAGFEFCIGITEVRSSNLTAGLEPTIVLARH